MKNPYFSSYIALHHQHKYWATTKPVSVCTKVTDKHKKGLTSVNSLFTLHCLKKKRKKKKKKHFFLHAIKLHSSLFCWPDESYESLCCGRSCCLWRLTKYFIHVAEWMFVLYKSGSGLPGISTFNIMHYTWVKGIKGRSGSNVALTS